MKFFLDTADLAEIEEAASWGALAGVTTNPTLYSRIGGKLDDFHAHIKRICDIVGSEQTGSPSTPGETFLKAAGQYAGLEDDGFFINHEAPASQGGTMPTLFSTTGLDVMETGKAPALTSGGFLAQQVT